MDLQVLAHDFLRHIDLERNLSHHTVTQYGRDIKRLLAHLQGEGVAADTDCVTVEHLRGFVRGLSSAGLSPSTIARIITCIRSLYTFGCRYHALPANPAAATVSPKVAHKLPEALTASEVARLLEACDDNHFRIYRVRDKCIVALLACLGLRRQELIDLELRDWDAGARTLRVRTGKGRRERVLPCPDELGGLLGQWLESRPAATVQNIFVSRQGCRLAPHTLQAMLKRLTAIAGLERKPHLHLFRHFAGTAIVSNHASGGIEQARRVLGHVSSETVAVYSHLTVDDLRPAVRDTAALSGIALRRAGGSDGLRLDAGTLLAARQLDELVRSLPGDWQQSDSVRRWIVTEWTRQCAIANPPAFARGEVDVIVWERHTAAHLSLDDHLAVVSVARVVHRLLNTEHLHVVTDLLRIDENLRGAFPQRSPGEPPSEGELRSLDSALPQPSLELHSASVLAAVVLLTSELGVHRAGLAGGQVTIDLLAGIAVWQRGLPPLIVPAAEAGLWRLLQARSAGGDVAPAVAYGLAKVAGVAGELSRLLAQAERPSEGGGQATDL